MSEDEDEESKPPLSVQNLVFMHQPKYYSIDWDKVKTTEDAITLLKIMCQHICVLDTCPDFDKARHFLKEVKQ